MTIEDETKGFVFPVPRQNVAVNEWGLAKTMCRCSGIPAWSRRTPPKCRTCRRKRAERRAKKEVERQKLKQAIGDASEMGGGSDCMVMVTPATVGEGKGRSNENTNDEGISDQMQIDEKGSGDMWATEKIVEKVTKEDSELPSHKDLISSELGSMQVIGDMKEDEKGAMEIVSETNRLKDAKESNFTSSENNVTMERKGGGDLEKNRKEVKQTTSGIKQVLASGSELSTAGSSDTKRTRKVVGINNSNETNGNTEMLSEANILRDIKQKVLPGITGSGSKQTKVKVANKYRTGTKTSREEISEV
jgi:hypothetical protein